MQAQEGDAKGAIETISAIGIKFSRVKLRKAFVLSGLARTLAERGNLAAAAIASREAMKLVSPRSGGPEKDATLVSIVGPLTDARNVEAALQYATAIRSASDRAYALTWIASSQARQGDRPAALATLRQALAIAGSLRSRHKRDEALGFIVRPQAEAGDIEAAVRTTELITDSLSRARAYREIAVVQAKSGDVAGALQTSRGIHHDSEKDDALAHIAAKQAERGDIAGALQTTTLIRTDGPSASALGQVAAMQARSGDAPGALTWASMQTSPLVKASALLGVAEGMMQGQESE